MPIPERSFTYAWSKAKREQGRGRAGTCTRPTVMQAILIEIAIHDTGSDDPERDADFDPQPAEGAPLLKANPCR